MHCFPIFKLYLNSATAVKTWPDAYKTMFRKQVLGDGLQFSSTTHTYAHKKELAVLSTQINKRPEFKILCLCFIQ